MTIFKKKATDIQESPILVKKLLVLKDKKHWRPNLISR